MRRAIFLHLLVLGLCGVVFAQAPRGTSLVEALRPALPFPEAATDGETPANGSPESKWFVVWPGSSDQPRVVVKANPLHLETQKAGAAAMERIQDAVIAAERKAQQEYDRVLAEVKRTGQSRNLEGISLDDEGAAGERIDADLELTIEVLAPAASYDVVSSTAPQVSPGTKGVSWIVHVPANSYVERLESRSRERFAAAESRLFYGTAAKPLVTRRGDAPLFTVTIQPSEGAFSVVLRGNEGLLDEVVASAAWEKLRNSP